MIFFNNPYTNPYFNLAAEEFLLNTFPEGFLMLWQNENTVVVGKHQNALGEINLEYVHQNKVKLARRISGGGTVFHDNGNLNFTIALPVLDDQKIIDFRKFIDPVISYLNSLGVNAEASGRNDIMVGDFKISGNAEHHFRKKKLILHHGTLLFKSDLENLGKAIKVIPGRYTDKAVQSKRSPVANISQFLSNPLSLSDFKEGLQEHLVKHFGVQITRDFSCEETDYVEALAVSKFEKDDWNYGYSPAYTFQSEFSFENSIGSIFLDVARDSIILEAKITHKNQDVFEKMAKAMVNQKHFPKVIDKIIRHFIQTEFTTELAPLTLSFF